MMIIINVLLKKGSAEYTIILVVVGIEIEIAGGIRPSHRWDMKLGFGRRYPRTRVRV